MSFQVPLEFPGTPPIHWKTKHLVILGLPRDLPGTSWDTTRTPRDPMDSLENKAFGDLGTPEGPARDLQGSPGTLRDLQGPPQGPSRTSQGPSRDLPGTSRDPQRPSRDLTQDFPGTPQGPSRDFPGTPRDPRAHLQGPKEPPSATQPRDPPRLPRDPQEPLGTSKSDLKIV